MVQGRIIDPEFPTTDGNKVSDNFANGKIGYVDTGLWYHLHETGNYGIKLKNKGVPLTIGTPVKGPAVNRLLIPTDRHKHRICSANNWRLDEKKRVKILQMLEYMAEDEKGYLATSYGQEGVDYDLKDGTAIPKGEYTDAQKRAAKTGAGAFYTAFTSKVPSMAKFDRPKDQLDFKAKYTSGMKILTGPIPGSILESEVTVLPTLKTLRDTYMTKAILGEANTDKDFDDFVAAWKKAGGEN